jgi:hypothetical protein
MPNLSFEIVSAGPARDMTVPAIAFEIRVRNAFPDQRIEAVLLRCQIRIETARRPYSAREEEQLVELFDKPQRWSDTLRPITWTTTSINVPGFSGSTNLQLCVPCSFDFTAAAPKYFHGLDAGEAPLLFLFSGTVFFTPAEGHALQAAPISWDKEARFRLRVETWRQVMDLHYPNAALLHLRRDVFEELYRYKISAGAASFDEAIERMLAMAAQGRHAS